MASTRKKEPVYAFGERTLAPALGAYFRWHFDGLDRIPKGGPAIVASNHLSYLDGLAVAYGVSRAGRRPRFLTKSGLFKVPVVGSALHALGQIPVLRGTREAPQSLEHAEAALRRGEVVVIFIEGTTSTTPGLELGRPKTGTARLALATGMDVVPCATWGGQWIWTKHLGTHLKPRQEVWVRFGEPISMAAWAGRAADRDAWREVSDLVMERIAELLAGPMAAKPWTPQRPTRKKFIAEQEAKEPATPSPPAGPPPAASDPDPAGPPPAASEAAAPGEHGPGEPTGSGTQA